MPWTNRDDYNWSVYETDSIRHLNDVGTTIEGRDMFHDLLSGGKARVRARGFSTDDLQRALRETDEFLHNASNEAGQNPIDVDHLYHVMQGFCPVFPI